MGQVSPVSAASQPLGHWRFVVSDVGLPPPLLYTPAEAAAQLRISRAKLFKLMADGRLPSVKIDRCRRVTAEALDTLVAQLTDAAA